VVRLRPSRTLLAFLFAGSLVGLLTMGAGLLAGHAANEEPSAIECAPFPMELQQQSWSEFQFLAPAEQAVHLDLDFLELNGDVMTTRLVQLSAGASTAFSMPTRYVGSAIQVSASGPVEIAVALTYNDSAGRTERKTVPCKPIPRPAHGGGP
jgi:hypothetical protein